jgi:alcohol dehydrogenase class IV
MAALAFAAATAVIAHAIATALNLPRPFMLGLSPADIAAGLLLAVVMAGVFVGIQRFCRRHVAPRIARADLRARAPTFDADPKRRA